MIPISKGKGIFTKNNSFTLEKGIIFLFGILLLSHISFSIADAASVNISENEEKMITGYSLLDFIGTESLLTTTTSGSNQELPALWEDRIVWISFYPDPADPESDLSEIYMYNLSSGGIAKLASGLSRVTLLDIWGDLVVWNTYGDDNSDIYLYNLSNNEIKRITNDSANQVKPRIWVNNIVWQEGDDTDAEWRVYLYNLTTEIAVELGDGSGLAMSPAIWDDRVIWQDWRNGADYDLFLYNITTGFETQITSDSANQIIPSIWGDLVVWQDDRQPSSQIYMYNIITGNETQVTNADANLEYPVIYGNLIAYVNQSDYFDIYLIDLLTGNQGKISNDLSGSAQMDPDIWGDRIVWTDDRNGDYDIFLYTLGMTMPPLTADFRQNITQGEPPLTIQFTDNSSGEVNGWNWDFGDNTSSTDKNPVHTYPNAGAFSVILTVHNLRQRNAMEKTQSISIGTPPIPQFNVNVSSGPAPLTVLFTDSSSGLPTSWHWNFGDGTTSDEQNQIHIYEVPGIYGISLTVNNTFGNASIFKQDFITVMDGTYYSCQVPSEGITVSGSGNVSQILVNLTNAVNCSFRLQENNSVLEGIPDVKYGIRKLSIFSGDTNGFSLIGNDTVSGSLRGVLLNSNDIAPLNFSEKIGENCYFHFNLSMPTYPADGSIHLVTWEGATPDDFRAFDNIKTLYNYVAIDDMAYSVRFHEENISQNCPATLTFGVSSDWVRTYGWVDNRTLDIRSVPEGAKVYIDMVFYGLTPINVTDLTPGSHEVVLISKGYHEYNMTMVIADERDSVHVIRIGDDGSGEVLNTTFIGYDPVQNLDFFRAESPNGLSTFGLASLSGSGNVFQIAQMVATSTIRPSGGGGGGGSSSGSSWVSENAAAQATTSVPSPTQIPEDIPLTISESPGDTGPVPSVSPGVTMEPGEPAPPPTGNTSFWGSITMGTSTLIILKNLSIVFVVIFVTTVFYLRWKRREE